MSLHFVSMILYQVRRTIIFSETLLGLILMAAGFDPELQRVLILVRFTAACFKSRVTARS